MEDRKTLRYVCVADLWTSTRDGSQPAPKCPKCREDMTAVPPEKLLRSPSEWKKKGLFKN
jgi:hypothetical protein